MNHKLGTLNYKSPFIGIGSQSYQFIPVLDQMLLILDKGIVIITIINQWEGFSVPAQAKAKSYK